VLSGGNGLVRGAAASEQPPPAVRCERVGIPPTRMIVGIGVDDVDVDRFRRSLERTPSLVDRLFTDGERAYASAAAPVMAVQRYAARFAAKEAVLKALGVGLGACGFHDIEVVRDDASGAPALALHAAAATLAAEQGVARWHLSMSHTETRATAFVVAERVLKA
jgi:holo-[acyl-carrier protein] synthase